VCFEIHGGTRTILFYFAHPSEDQRLDTKTILRNKAPPNRKRAAEADHRAEAGQTLTPNAIAAFEVLLISNSLAYCELYLAFADMGPNPVCARDHCDCDGTTPLLSSEVSGTWTMNCDYAVQPVTALALGH
jgi:hypothetical protein